MTMTLYTTLGVRDVNGSIPFYDAIFGVLGHRRQTNEAEWATWGPEYNDGVSFSICTPIDGAPVTVGNGTMFALRGKNVSEVDRFYEAALENGGKSEGAPGTREAMVRTSTSAMFATRTETSSPAPSIITRKVRP